MLSAAFGFSVFASVVWMFFSISNTTNGEINGFVVTTAVVVLPIFILWCVFGYIYQYLSVSVLNKNMYSLFKQMKRNQENTDMIARLLLEQRNNLLDNVVLDRFDVFVADMNELLSDILIRGQLVSPEQINILRQEVKSGSNWAFGKKILELSRCQNDFPRVLQKKAIDDSILGGTVMEFCSRYQSLVNTLEKHDKERLFLNIVETGVLGKVFSILASPADSIRQNRDLTLTHQQMSEPEFEKEREVSLAPMKNYEYREDKKQNGSLTENARKLFMGTFRKKETSKEQEKDPLSEAFAKSFGAREEDESPRFEPSLSEPETRNEPVLSAPSFDDFSEEEPVEPLAEPEEMFEKEAEVSIAKESVVESAFEPVFTRAPINEEKERETMPEIILNNEMSSKEEPPFVSSVIHPGLIDGFANTTEWLADIKQEWEAARQRDMDMSKPPMTSIAANEGMPEPKVVGNDSDFSYPFGGWMNADNYHK